MLIRIPKVWTIPECAAAPEAAWINRRQWIAAAFPAAQAIAQQRPPAVRRNPDFALDRPITPESAATSYNNFYEFDANDKSAVKDKVSAFLTSPWKIEVAGLVNKPQTFDLDTLLRRMPLEERLYRFRCVEAWAMAVPWTGFPFAELARLVEPRPEARYVRFTTVYRPDQMPGIRLYDWYKFPYYEALRIDEAMHPLTLLATGLYGKSLPKQNGAPVRLVVPWKYGYKSPKSIVKIEFVSKRPHTFWNDSQPREYGFFSNVNPARPHPRWSQATERLIPTGEVRPTQPYNGYEKLVASLYNGSEF